ncbi:PGF-pre-PGF domain-containing protein [uncultured Methanomethylovorans sp.]|uniref:PGF-pre-PGF domain-containing protein n=1 Tax=uncultured Methanomethylovorans sp. TaxID=183759 RepID=UPI002AA8F5D2|nr:PGF-pre-PGF domain-containing protein [uncultured Methanomethylovorans sp.]
MYKKILCLILLTVIIAPVAASEVTGPLSYVKYDGKSYTITGADAPSLLSDKEILSIDLSNGTTIDSDHFYYAATQEENRTDYLGKAYTIDVINDTAVLSSELWKGLNMNVYQGGKIDLPEEYTLECTKTLDNGDSTFILTHNKMTLDSFCLKENGRYNYSKLYEGKKVVVFSVTSGDSLHEKDMASLTEISIKKVDVLKNGQDIFGNYTISFEDIDWDGDEDIVIRLKSGNTFTITPSEDTSLLDGYICLKSEIKYNQLLDKFDKSTPLAFSEEYEIYSYRHSDIKDFKAEMGKPSSDSIFSVAPYIKFNGMGTILTDTAKETNISMQLRGEHEIYTYVNNETLSLSISKHDLNWYKGADELNVTVYSSKGEIVGNMTIHDDGQTSATRTVGNIQTETLEVTRLQNGIYHIELKSNDDDIVIDELHSDQDKLVFDGKIFVLSPGDLYVGSNKRFSLKFMTLHDEGLQNITIEGNNHTYHTKLDTKNKWINIKLPPSISSYRIKIPKGDVKVESDAYFAFSEEAFFSKDQATVVSLYDTISKKQEQKVDYIIVPRQKEQIAFYPYRNTTDYTYFDPSNYDNELNTWTSPGLFYSGNSGKGNWEFLNIVPEDDNILSKDEMVYGTLQYKDNSIESPLNRTIAYLGEPYCILDIDNSSAVLSKRTIADMEILVNSSSKVELGDGMYLQMHSIDMDMHKISCSIYRERDVLSNLEIEENYTTIYKEVINDNEIPLLSIECGKIIKDDGNPGVQLRINKISGHAIVLKDHDTFKDGSTTEITDINGDKLQDIKITLEENSDIRLEEGEPVAILGGYLTLEPVENNKILVSKKNISTKENTLNIKVQYGSDFSFKEPVKEIPVTIDSNNLSSFNIYYNTETTDFSFLLKELKRLPSGDKGIRGEIYDIYDLSLYPTNPGTIYTEFFVEKQWLEYRGLEPENVYVAQFKNGGWAYISTNNIGDKNGKINFSVSLRDTGIFCILALPNNSERYNIEPEDISYMLRSIADDISGNKDLDNGSVEILSSKARSSSIPVYIALFMSIVCVAILLTYANRNTSSANRTEEKRKNEKYRKIMEFNRRLCLVLIASSMILQIAEEIQHGSVSSHMDTTIILICAIITGFIDIVGRKLRKKEGL